MTHGVLSPQRDYGDNPWRIVESDFRARDYGLNATLFALGNGTLGVRGTLEEGLSGGELEEGCYLNGVYFAEPITYGEKAYGYAKHNERIAQVAVPGRFNLSVDGERVDMGRGELLAHRRELALDEGFLHRASRWRSPRGQTLTIESRRLVSLAEDHLVLVQYRVAAEDADVTLALEVLLDARPPQLADSDDPRVGAGINPEDIEPLASESRGQRLFLAQRLKSSGFVVACGADHQLDTEAEVSVAHSAEALCRRCTYNLRLKAGQSFTLTQTTIYRSGRDLSLARVEQSIEPLLARCAEQGFAHHLRTQRAALDQFWSESDIEIGGDLALQQGLRFNLFHLFQSLGRRPGTNIAAKGLSGHGYDGHYFWDTEIYILPFFLYTQPTLARNLVEYRYRLLDAARARARELAIERGALFPWRTIGGQECSAYYPAGTAQYHINADIAYAVQQYHQVTGDDAFIKAKGAEVVMESARLWLAIGHYNPRKGDLFCINTVTGPDEYTALVDNNFFTNAMAQRHLSYAAELYLWLAKDDPDALTALVDKIGVTDDEVAEWCLAAERMYLPYDESRAIHLQDDGFLDRPRWPFEQTPADHYPLLLHYHPLVIYRHQVCKQADTILALFLLSDSFDRDAKRRDFDFYEPLTTHDSTLSACMHSIIASEVGYPDRAWNYFSQVVRMDLDNRHHNTQHGVHTACMGGTWLCMVQGFAGMRLHKGQLHFAPSLPEGMTHYRFRIQYRGSTLAVSVDAHRVTYEVVRGSAISLQHGDRTLTVSAPVTVSLQDL